MKEKIYLNKNEQLFAEFKEIQRLQFEMDKKKKEWRTLSEKIRSLGQDIPSKIRRLKL